MCCSILFDMYGFTFSSDKTFCVVNLYNIMHFCITFCIMHLIKQGLCFPILISFHLKSSLICKRQFCVLIWEQKDGGSNYSRSRDWCYPDNYIPQWQTQWIYLSSSLVWPKVQVCWESASISSEFERERTVEYLTVQLMPFFSALHQICMRCIFSTL